MLAPEVLLVVPLAVGAAAAAEALELAGCAGGAGAVWLEPKTGDQVVIAAVVELFVAPV
jgi:hypothetical protein